MEQQLAVEWFANRISHGGLVTKKQFNDLLEKAKAMEEDGKHASYLYGHKVGYKKAEQIQNDQIMYSEKEVRELLLRFNDDKPGAFNCSEWFEKNKKQQEQKKMNVLIIIDFLGFLIFSFCILLWFAYAFNGFKW